MYGGIRNDYFSCVFEFLREKAKELQAKSVRMFKIFATFCVLTFLYLSIQIFVIKAYFLLYLYSESAC